MTRSGRFANVGRLGSAPLGWCCGALPSCCFARLARPIALLLAGGCASFAGPPAARLWSVPVTVADSIATERLAPGIFVHHLVRTAVPLRVHVLDIDLVACVTVRALKGAATAVGRTVTSDLLRSIPAADRPVAAVNADSSLFTPPGVPVGALVQDGRVIAGPIDRPVLAFDVNGRASIGRLAVIGSITSARGRVAITSWNRPSAKSVGVVDAAWGQALDSLTRPGALRLVPLGACRYRVETLPPTMGALAQGDTMLLVGSDGATLREQDTVHVEIALGPQMPANALGAYPTLVRDSIVVSSVDSLGAVSFRGSTRAPLWDWPPMGDACCWW